MLRTFKLTIAYDGTDFAGWQVQPGKPTVQGMLQKACRAITGADIVNRNAAGSIRGNNEIQREGERPGLTEVGLDGGWLHGE